MAGSIRAGHPDVRPAGFVCVIFSANYSSLDASMKFALIDDQRHEAEPGLKGTCPIHGHPMVAKCGELRTWHWAHKGSLSCDPWWENETDWHRNWKGQFPREWQEVVHHDEQGEKHIADVKTDREWIIEFQHSHIKPEERRSRDFFYKRLIWIVDGTRRKKDAVQFLKSWNRGAPVGQNPRIRRILPDECALLREWSASTSHVFLDFGEQAPLWWVFNKGPSKPMYLMIVPRAEFVGIHSGNTPQDARAFDDIVKDIDGLVAQHEAYLIRIRQMSYQLYSANNNRRRKRL